MNLFISHFISFWLSVLNTTRYPTRKASLSKIEMLPLVLFNQFLVFLGIYFMIDMIPHYSGTFLNWIVDFIWKYPCMMLTMNLLFGSLHYMSHRIKWIYQNVHYIHHRLIVSDGMGAIYTHPLEQIFVNMMPIGIAIILFNANIYLTHIFVISISWGTVQGHTYYGEKEFSKHILHHYYRMCNFDNSPYILDRILGTLRKK